MINSLISALIAIFFWSKLDAKDKERIRKASLIRTMVYLVLSVFIFVFYLKSNQVATVNNVIAISNGLADYNSKGEVLDSVYSLEIYNNFSGEATYQNDFVDYLQRNNAHGGLFAESSGINMKIMVHTDMLDSIQAGPFFDKESYIDQELKDLDINHLFKVFYVSTSIPSLLPVFPEYNETSGLRKDEHYFQKNVFENSRNSQLLSMLLGDSNQHAKDIKQKSKFSEIFKNGLLLAQVIGTKNFRDIEIEQEGYLLEDIFSSYFVNNLNIFTAADISQYAYVLSFISELPIKNVSINYDVPIETQPLNESIKVGPNSMYIDGKGWNYLNNNTMMFYVKLPTMANLQLIRSFVLTTLLTLLMSLFFRNAYYWVRKCTEEYKKRHRLPYKEAKYLSKYRIRLFKGFITLIIILFFVSLIAIIWLVSNGQTLLVSLDVINYGIYLIAGFVLLNLILLLILYRFGSKPVIISNKKNKYKSILYDYLKLFAYFAIAIICFIGIGYYLYNRDLKLSHDDYYKASDYELEGNYEKALDLYLKAANKGDVLAQNQLGVFYKEGTYVTQSDAEALKWFRMAADNKYEGGQLNLGLMYEEGRGVEQNDAEAVKWIRMAAEQGLAEAQYELAIILDKGVQKNEVEVLEWLKKAVSQGYSKAQRILAFKYEYGIGVKQNFEAAFDLFMAAAKQGDDIAQWSVGYMYSEGKGRERDDKEAFKWYKLSAGQGNGIALWSLGNMYEEGWGVDQDIQEAIRMYKKAIDKGERLAMNSLGVLYATGKGVEKDLGEARKLFHQAAELGDARAQYNLGRMYEVGNGVQKDELEAFKWYQLAAEQDDMESQYKVGEMYEYGNGVSQKDSLAFYWYKKSAELGSAKAQLAIGEMYMYGKGVTQDFSEGEKWYRKAAELGNTDAQNNLGAYYYRNQNYSDAYKWFHNAAENGNATAQNNLGILYERGEGVAKSYTEAAKWYKEAISNGNEDAKENLRDLNKKMKR